MKKESRIALVVGNSNYDDHELPFASKNAREMKKFLEKNGFYVYYGENLDKRNFVRLLRKFNKNLKPKGIGLVYFAGHAMQHNAKNYLLPIDSGILDASMVIRKSIALNSIYSGMNKSYNRLNIVILDTAFEKPLGDIFVPQKSGLAAIHSSKAQVSFIASKANTLNRSETFTKDFIALAKRKGLELTALKYKLLSLRRKHAQPTPQISIVRQQPFYFVLPDHIPTADELAYSKIKESQDKPALENFLNTYPKSRYTVKIEQRLSNIQAKERALQKERQQQLFQKQAEEATRKAKEAAALEIKRIHEEEKREEREKQLTAQKAAERHEVSFKLTKPEDIKETKKVKPKAGEERQIHLE